MKQPPVYHEVSIITNKGIIKLKTFAKGCQVQVWGLDGLQEFKVLYEGTKIK